MGVCPILLLIDTMNSIKNLLFVKAFKLLIHTLVNFTLILCSTEIMLPAKLVSHMNSLILTANILRHSEKKNTGEKLNKI
jgi:hypothetical protein